MGKTALIIIDMINTYDHPDVELLPEFIRSASAFRPVVKRI